MDKVKFQQEASEQGQEFEKLCHLALRKSGWDVTNKHFKFEDVGIDVDIVANNAHGIAFTFSCAGSWNPNRPGLERTDTVKKKIADAYLQTLSEDACRFPPVVLMTTHVPTKGRAAAMLDAVGRNVILDVIRPEDTKRLKELCGMSETDIHKFVGK